MKMSNTASYLQTKKKTQQSLSAGKVITYVFLVLWALIVLFPFYWMILTSVKSYSQYNAERIPSFFTQYRCRNSTFS